MKIPCPTPSYRFRGHAFQSPVLLRAQMYNPPSNYALKCTAPRPTTRSSVQPPVLLRAQVYNPPSYYALKCTTPLPVLLRAQVYNPRLTMRSSVQFSPSPRPTTSSKCTSISIKSHLSIFQANQQTLFSRRPTYHLYVSDQ